MNHHEQIISKLQEDLVLRGLAPRTQQNYVQCVRIFLAYCNRPVEQLGEKDIRHFLLYLIQEKKLATRTINLHSSAIQFDFSAFTRTADLKLEWKQWDSLIRHRLNRRTGLPVFPQYHDFDHLGKYFQLNRHHRNQIYPALPPHKHHRQYKYLYPPL